MLFVKLSMLFFLRRLFPGKRFGWWLVVTGIVIIGYSALGFLALILQCIPLAHLWNPTIPAHCLDLGLVSALSGAINIVTDFMILASPVMQIRRLQVKRGKKRKLIIIFTIGGL